MWLYVQRGVRKVRSGRVGAGVDLTEESSKLPGLIEGVLHFYQPHDLRIGKGVQKCFIRWGSKKKMGSDGFLGNETPNSCKKSLFGVQKTPK